MVCRQARSRSIGFKFDGGQQALILPPAIDMANHASSPACNAAVYLDEAGSRVVLRPLRPIGKNEVIIINIG
jgi:hypothetical protein